MTIPIHSAKLPQIGIVRLGIRDNTGRGVEVDHFIFDVNSPGLKGRIASVYGDRPASIDITFYSDDISRGYRSEYQMWGTSGKGTPYLMCSSADGVTAKEFGKSVSRPCPCDHRDKGCRRKTILRFLMPRIAMGGTFLLITKSEHSTAIIQTTLELARRSGSLIMRPFRLLRTEGYARVKGVRVKKYYIALVLDEALEEKPASLQPAVPRGRQIEGFSRLIPPPLSEEEEADIAERQEKAFLKKARGKVRMRLRLRIADPRGLVAMEEYACIRFGRDTFEDLTRQELRKLWHDIAESDDVVARIYEQLKALRNIN